MSVYADHPHPLVCGGRTAETLAVLLGDLEAVRLPGLLELTALPRGGQLGAALSQAEASGRMVVETRRDRGEAYARFGADVAASAGAGPAGVKWSTIDDPEHLEDKAQGKFRQAARALERAAGAPLVVRDTSGDRGAVERFPDLQMSGWKRNCDTGGAALRLNATEEAWFRAVVAAFMPRGDVIILELLAGDALVYSTFVRVSGAAAFGFLDTHEGSLVRRSRGIFGRLAACAQLMARPAAAFFAAGRGHRFTEAARLYRDRRDLVDVVAVHGLGPRLVVRELHTARRLKSVARRVRRPSGPQTRGARSSGCRACPYI